MYVLCTYIKNLEALGMETTCTISGENFTISEHEMQLRQRFDLGDSIPKISPKARFQHVGAFWPMWALHRRKCDRSGKTIVSVFRPDCEYPVWSRDEWVEHADPPFQDFDFERPFFEQAWEVFKKSPIPNNFQSNNQNCEYTDDWYRSKNCYLCHSGQNNEDCRYCYGCDNIKDVYGGVFSFNSELCLDIINSSSCFNSKFLLNCKNVNDSAFLYDCRDCSDCLFSFNLRNKQYCFANQQLTKEEFEKKKAEWNFKSSQVYEHAKEYFSKMMHEVAWHRATQIDRCENSSGCFIRDSKDCENCYILSSHENCANVSFSGPHAKTILDSLGTVGAELAYMCSLPVYSYDARFCYSVDSCKFVEYSAYLQNCQYCFGCCGLMNKKYCILNKQYTKEEYEALVPRIIEHMKSTGEWGEFFPAYFAPNPYEESFSGYHFPLDEDDKRFKRAQALETSAVKTAEIADIPDSVDQVDEDWLTSQVFWDEKYNRPFQIQKADIDFTNRIKGPLPNCYYIHRIQDNFKWMPFAGELRETTCAKSGVKVLTNWPASLDARILSEDYYLSIVK